MNYSVPGNEAKTDWQDLFEIANKLSPFAPFKHNIALKMVLILQKLLICHADRYNSGYKFWNGETRTTLNDAERSEDSHTKLSWNECT